MMLRNNIILLSVFLSACASPNEHLYYETVKSLSKDQTMVQTACLLAMSEIAKTGNNSTKTNAIDHIDKCKINSIKLVPPYKPLLHF